MLALHGLWPSLKENFVRFMSDTSIPGRKQSHSFIRCSWRQNLSHIWTIICIKKRRILVTSGWCRKAGNSDDLERMGHL